MIEVISMGFEVMSAVIMLSTGFWNVMPCSLAPFIHFSACSSYSLNLKMETVCLSYEMMSLPERWYS
jgi:hypothetical protein